MWPDGKTYVEVIAALTVPISFVAVIIHRLKSEMGMGYRSLQFLAIGVVLPIALILALEKVLDGGSISTLFGAVVGYLFSTATKDTATKEAK